MKGLSIAFILRTCCLPPLRSPERLGVLRIDFLTAERGRRAVVGPSTRTFGSFFCFSLSGNLSVEPSEEWHRKAGLYEAITASMTTKIKRTM